MMSQIQSGAEIRVDVAVIGAGSAGLSALRRVKKKTDNFVLINSGLMGTKCARAGCMPSKAFIHVARDFHRRRIFDQRGIHGSEHLKCEPGEVLQHVRKLRDGFTSGMVETTHELAGDRFIEGSAKILGHHYIQVNDSVIEAGRIVIATGARPLVPKKWEPFSDRILTSENIFEQETLPARLAVIGLGPVGLELGQALNRIGVSVTGFDMVDRIGGLTDPEVNASAIKAFSDEFPLFLGKAAEIEQAGEELIVRAGDDEVRVDKLLLAMGVRPNIDGLGLDALGLVSDDGSVKGFDPTTAQVGDLPIFMAGDVDGDRAILHEALDDGFIAGNNAVSDEVACYQRRPTLRLVFSEPELFVVGRSFDELDDSKTIIGQVSFQDQSRAVMQGKNKGLLQVYADKSTARILGAEGAAPEGEHLGHLLALAIHRESTVFDMLQMPFYHPTIEEGLQTALENAADQLPSQHRPPELSLCQSRPEDVLC